MNEGFYRQTAAIESTHWWFRHRRRLVQGLLEGWSGESALDVGCGTGGNLPLLGRHCTRVTGLDRSRLALQLARSRGNRGLICGDANRLKDHFRAQSFDLITLFNVLYHRWIPEPEAVLAQSREILRPGGRLIITEAAFASLFRRHDVVGFGARRFRLAPLREALRAAGFAPRRATYFNALALPPAWLEARLERRAGGELGAGDDVPELRPPPRWVNQALFVLCGLERGWIGIGGRVPAGVGILLLAEPA